MKQIGAVCLVFGLATPVYAGGGTSTHPVRQVKGNTIVSEESPRAELTIQDGFRFVGTQQVNLYGAAEAEQFVFVKAGGDKVVQSFYLVQFEHYLPTNEHTYKYEAKRTTQLGELQFVYNVGSFPDYAAVLTGEAGSDGAALGSLLAKQRLALPHRAVHVRMFHLPTADHRSELMIIYGEALAEKTEVPVGKDPMQLDTEAPGLAKVFLERARRGIQIKTK